MFENAIEQSLFRGASEKTFIDKILAKDDVNALRELVKKPRLNRQDLLDILYLLSSAESKLLNYGEWDRYVILKFFVWIREFVEAAELLYDYVDDREKRIKSSIPSEMIVENVEVSQLLDNARRRLEHSVKFLIDVYLNINRTTLSLGASGFKEILNNKFEINYSGQQGQQMPQAEAQKGGLFKR